MSETLVLFSSYLAGMLLGALFFGGLWLTIRKAISSSHPAAWFLVSLVLRMAVTLGGFFVVSAGSWQRMSACVLGFMTSRLLVTRLIRTGDAMCVCPIEEIGNAH